MSRRPEPPAGDEPMKARELAQLAKAVICVAALIGLLVVAVDAPPVRSTLSATTGAAGYEASLSAPYP